MKKNIIFALTILAALTLPVQAGNRAPAITKNATGISAQIFTTTAVGFAAVSLNKLKKEQEARRARMNAQVVKQMRKRYKAVYYPINK